MIRRLLTMAAATVALGATPAARGDAGPGAGEPPAAVHATGAGAPSVDLEVPEGDLELGSPFFAVVRARHAPSVQVSVPETLVLGADIEELRRASASRRDPDGSATRTVELELMAFGVGELALPRIPVHYVSADGAGQVLTDSARIEVRDPLADDGADAELRDIASPVSIERRDLTWVYAIAAALAAGAIAAIVGRVRRRAALRRDAADPTDAAPPPDREALARLEALAASGTLEAADRRPAYFEMSEIVRGYLARRYGFPALDLTTHEIRDALGDHAGAAARDLVLAWLRDVDGVKYAGYGASVDEARDALDRAVELVLELRGPAGGREASR